MSDIFNNKYLSDNTNRHNILNILQEESNKQNNPKGKYRKQYPLLWKTNKSKVLKNSVRL
jgi:hypothetical protein